MQKNTVYIFIPQDLAKANNVGRYTYMDIYLSRDGSLKIFKHDEGIK